MTAMLRTSLGISSTSSENSKQLEVQKKISNYQVRTPSSQKLSFLCRRSISFLLEIKEDRGHKEAIRKKTLTMAVRYSTEPREAILLTTAVTAVITTIVTCLVNLT